MSKAYDKGYEEAQNNYGPLEAEEWHSIAHAQGWICGLESLIDNYSATPPDKYTTRKDLDLSIERMEKAIKQTENLIEQVEGSVDHKNQIQSLCKEIERLRNTIWK